MNLPNTAAQKYQAEYAKYKVAYEKVLVQYNQWREATIAEFNKTKIVIPEKYQELVDQLNNLSK